MSFRITTRIAAENALVMCCLLAGCNTNTQTTTKSSNPPPADQNAPQPPAPNNTQSTEEKKNVAIKKLILSKENSSQYSIRLGVLQFDDSNHATLTTEGAGAAVEKLKNDWNEVASQPELTWKTSVPGVVDGKEVMRVVGKSVHPGDDTYPQAVLNTMERSYGYAVEIGN